MNTNNGYRVWCYVPDEELTGWDAPHCCMPTPGEVDGDCYYEAEDAHHVARMLRGIYHGHLFAVVPVGKTPLPTR